MQNKLGFYLQSFEIGQHKGDLFRAIQEIRPPTMLVHAWDQVDQLRRLSPDSFIIGRMTYFGADHRSVDQTLANEWLDSDDPEARGREFAAHILRDNFENALKQEGGRRLVDAWMSLNEPIPGPASDDFRVDRAQISRRLSAYDAFQIGFRNTLIDRDIEAVAFNFGAGNFQTAEHYLAFFPRTLAAYNYLGFHEYGWPALSTEVDARARSSAGSYRPIAEGLSRATGRRYSAIMTELGLAMMYKHHDYLDRGWLDIPPPELGIETVSQDDYWRSLQWMNDYMSRDDIALGACLYEVGHAGDWESFRHFGTDNQGAPIEIMDHIRRLVNAPPGILEALQPQTPVTLRGRVIGAGNDGVGGALIRLVGDIETLGDDPGAVLYNRSAVTWTRTLTGYTGTLWNCWQKHLGPNVAGITWEEFRAEAIHYNPGLRETDGALQADRTYFLPENRTFSDTGHLEPAITWDRTLRDFEGNRWECWQRYVGGKVWGLNWRTFKDAVMAANPVLAAEGGRFRANQEYQLPQSAGQDAYTRVTYSLERGGFAFADLARGSYRVEVSATGYQRLVQGLDVTSDLEIILPLEPTIRPESIAFALEVVSPFVWRSGRQFAVGGQSFKFMGVNLRGLVHYGTETLPIANARDQLSAARDIGARVVRVFLPSIKVSAEAARERLAQLIGLMQREFPEMYLIVALSNLYGDVDFRVPGDDAFYTLQPGGQGPHILNLDWFREGYKRNYLPFVEMVVSRFRDEPTIMAYNIGNELKAEGAPELLVQFMHAAARRIRELDSHHLLTTGMISTRHAHMQGREALRDQLYGAPLFDFITNHAYHNEGNDRPSQEDDSDLAERLSKPLLIEEAGFEGRHDRTDLYVREMDQLFGRGASGYMPWGFMSGGDNGDGDGALGLDSRFHGADWDRLRDRLRERARHLAAQTTSVETKPGKPSPGPVVIPPPESFAVGQRIVAVKGARLRQSPGLNAGILATLTRRASGIVTGAAEQKNRLTWQRVRLSLDGGKNVEGWMALAGLDGTPLLIAAPPDVTEPQPRPEPEPKPEPRPEPAPPTWDARLDALGVRLERKGDWRLVAAAFKDESEAQGRHHIDIKALRPDGAPAAGVRFVADWEGRRADENPAFGITDERGETNIPMFIVMHPDRKDGIMFAAPADAPGDTVRGMGLPNHHHVCFVLTYRLTPPGTADP